MNQILLKKDFEIEVDLLNMIEKINKILYMKIQISAIHLILRINLGENKLNRDEIDVKTITLSSILHI